MEKEQLFENILKENVELDNNYAEFKEAFEDNMKSYLNDAETLDSIVSKELSGRWAVRSYRDYYVVLNVKGKGAGNYDRFNLNNRAESVDKLASYDYEKMMFHHIDDFWEDLKEDFRITILSGNGTTGQFSDGLTPTVPTVPLSADWFSIFIICNKLHAISQ